MTFFMSQGARNWPFLMFTGLPDCATARMKSVWRHRKAGVCSTSTTLATSALGGVVHVGQDGQLQLAAHFIEDLQARLQAHAALAGARRAVGLVERAFVDQGTPAQCRSPELACDVQRHLLAFDGAGARDQEEAVFQANVEAAEFPGSLSFNGPGLQALFLVFHGRLDEGVEQRVAVPGRGFELGVELHRCTRVHGLGQFDDLREVLALGQRGITRPAARAQLVQVLLLAS